MKDINEFESDVNFAAPSTRDAAPFKASAKLPLEPELSTATLTLLLSTLVHHGQDQGGLHLLFLLALFDLI